jgi:hypothetical protein
MTEVSRIQPSIVERLRSSEPLPACPFDRISPLYLTMPDDKPCPFCGQENTLEGPDKCRGADTRIFGEAADRIEFLEGQVEGLTESFSSLAEVANTVPALKARVAELETELASCRACREKIDCLSRGER